MPVPVVESEKFPRLKSKSLRASVFDALRDAILKGRVRPGEVIREVPIAQEFGVSQNTVREALLQLEAEGLVVRTPNRQTTVTSLSPSDVWDRVSLRMALEPYLSIIAARRMDEDDFQALRDILQRLTQAERNNKFLEVAEADLDFHRYIWEKSGNKLIYQILNQACVQMFAFVNLFRFRQADGRRLRMNSHEDLLTALKSGDPGRISESWRAHFRGSYREFMAEDAGEIESLMWGVERFSPDSSNES